jgi:hypothetical protein
MLAVFCINQAGMIVRSAAGGTQTVRYRINIAAHSSAFRNASVDSSQQPVFGADRTGAVVKNPLSS